MTETPLKLCPQCSKPIKGRSDKKFCNQYCKTDYNNGINKSKNPDRVRNINDILLQNRKILLDLKQRKLSKIKEDNLITLGYNIHFHTHSIKRGKTVKIFCYDVGYIKKTAGVIYVVLSDEN
jgi:predicted nucleic acid-binding Zn ribbon protein